jgi:hypothetical protein
MPLSAPTERETFDSDHRQSFVITFQSDPVSVQTFVIVIVEIGRTRARKKIREAAGAKYAGKAKAHKEKKTYLTLFPRERNTIYDIKERAKRSEPTQSMLFSITDSFRVGQWFMFIHHRRFAFLSTLSLSSLSLSRARAKRRTNERDQKTNEGKCAHAHKTQARARTGKTESDIQIRVFSHSRLTQNRSVDFVHRHLRDRSRQIRTHFPSARAFYVYARAYLATVPACVFFFFCVLENVTP